MLEIGNTLISDEVIDAQFVCNISACKGVCCVDGDAGAPLDEEETRILDELSPTIKKYLRKEGIEALEAQGNYVIDADGDLVTPLVNGKECAYVVFDKGGAVKCGIEKAYEDGAIDYKKPISCHLYPIRLSKVGKYTALNYHEWDLCKPACELGIKSKTNLIDFLKDVLIRRFGKEWYDRLKYYKHYSENKEEK